MHSVVVYTSKKNGIKGSINRLHMSTVTSRVVFGAVDNGINSTTIQLHKTTGFVSTILVEDIYCNNR